MWEVGSWKPFAKAQPLQKATCHSIGWAPWGGTGLGLHPSLLLATGEGADQRAAGRWRARMLLLHMRCARQAPTHVPALPVL